MIKKIHRLLWQQCSKRKKKKHRFKICFLLKWICWMTHSIHESTVTCVLWNEIFLYLIDEYKQQPSTSTFSFITLLLFFITFHWIVYFLITISDYQKLKHNSFDMSRAKNRKIDCFCFQTISTHINLIMSLSFRTALCMSITPKFSLCINF